jgi:DNA-binding MarR family transcriptional regulator
MNLHAQSATAYPQLASLSNGIGAVLKLYPSMPVQRLSLLLCIAEHPGITMTELTKVARMSQSSVSRNVGALGMDGWRDGHGRQQPGLRLVEAIPNPENRRQKIVRPTRLGEGVVGLMVAAMEY